MHTRNEERNVPIHVSAVPANGSAFCNFTPTRLHSWDSLPSLHPNHLGPVSSSSPLMLLSTTLPPPPPSPLPSLTQPLPLLPWASVSTRTPSAGGGTRGPRRHMVGIHSMDKNRRSRDEVQQRRGARFRGRGRRSIGGDLPLPSSGMDPTSRPRGFRWWFPLRAAELGRGATTEAPPDLGLTGPWAASSPLLGTRRQPRRRTRGAGRGRGCQARRRRSNTRRVGERGSSAASADAGATPPWGTQALHRVCRHVRPDAMAGDLLLVVVVGWWSGARTSVWGGAVAEVGVMATDMGGVRGGRWAPPCGGSQPSLEVATWVARCCWRPVCFALRFSSLSLAHKGSPGQKDPREPRTEPKEPEPRK
jgi:hypothetical protein